MTATAASLRAEALRAIAAGLATSASLDVPAGTERTWVRVAANDSWEAWLIRWPPGTSVGLHDHGGSSGAFSVVRGQLQEVVVTAGRRTIAVHSAGATRSFCPDVVHDVGNVGDGPAVSVHVYSPPLTTMRRHDWAPSGIEAA
jgi:quercetin dioxygenase-like cupin family protein